VSVVGDEEGAEHKAPTSVVMNIESTGRKIIVQLASDVLIETEVPFDEDFRSNVSFLVDETIRLGDRVLVSKCRDVMLG
jgi:hypothetical protein